MNDISQLSELAGLVSVDFKHRYWNAFHARKSAHFNMLTLTGAVANINKKAQQVTGPEQKLALWMQQQIVLN